MEESSNFGRAFGDSFAAQLTGRIMVVAILVLFVVVVLVVLLRLYARFFWLRTEEVQATSETRRRRRSHRLVFAASHDPAASNSRRGLDLAVLSSLPIVVFGSEEFKDGVECAVCLSDIVNGEKARVLPKCNHGFHLECINMWFQSHSTCPLCRNVVAPAPDCSNLIGSPLEVDLEAQIENSLPGFPSESPNLPTNVLFWGNQREVSCLQEWSSSSGESDGSLGLDIPNVSCTASCSLSSPASAARCCTEEDEGKSAVSTGLRSLKRLLSRETRLSP